MALRTFLSDRGDTGRRLDLVLRRHLANLEAATRNRVQTWIDDGTVSINGQTVRRAAARIAAGDVLTVNIPDADIPSPRPIEPHDAAVDILFEDDYLLVVNKPAGLVVHPTHAHPAETLMNRLMWYARDWPGTARPSIVGRLDKLTSGIVLIAKSAGLHARLQRTMAKTATTKDYLALVYGPVNVPHGTIELRLRRDPGDRRKVVASTSDGAPSLTAFVRLARAAPQSIDVALLRCRLLTGRTHQIRAHLRARGWPIVGDPVYAPLSEARMSDSPLTGTLRAFPRQALHSWRLAFEHPITMMPVSIEAPVPADMRALMSSLEIACPSSDPHSY
jgi:23S rRNA pseudouridine1911/1915/1917 synthase